MQFHPAVQRAGPDWGAAMRGLLLLAFAGGVFGLIRSGDIGLYINPRFVPFTAAALVAVALMAVVQLWRFAALSGDGGAGPGRYLVFLVPLLLGLALPPATLGADLAARRGVNLTARNRGAALAGIRPDTKAVPAAALPVAESATPVPPGPGEAAGAGPPPPAPARAAGSSGTNPVPVGASAPAVGSDPAPAPSAADPKPVAAAPASNLPPASGLPNRGAPALVNGKVVLNNQNFAAWLLAAYERQGQYVGKPVELQGFVFRPPEMGKGEFVLARLVVTCHVAHAVPDGFLVYWPQGDELKEDTWFQLEGVFELGKYRDQDLLRIKAHKLTPVEQPKDPYIYG